MAKYVLKASKKFSGIEILDDNVKINFSFFKHSSFIDKCEIHFYNHPSDRLNSYEIVVNSADNKLSVYVEDDKALDAFYKYIFRKGIAIESDDDYRLRELNRKYNKDLYERLVTSLSKYKIVTSQAIEK